MQLQTSLSQAAAAAATATANFSPKSQSRQGIHPSFLLSFYIINEFQFQFHLSQTTMVESKRQHIQIQDRISDLSDCVLLHILSFLNAKEAVQTCILSKRWINLWKTLSTLTLSVDHFGTNQRLKRFLSMLLSLRDHSTDIHSLVVHEDIMDHNLYQKIIEYAFSRNIQHFQIHYTPFNLLPSCFFSSLTLTSLTLTGINLMLPRQHQIFPCSHSQSFNFPALTTLSLKHLCFCCNDNDNDNDNGSFVDPFSTFNMLNTLIIDHCALRGNAQNLRISCTKLVNLTLHMCPFSGLFPTTTTKADFKINFGIELCAPTLHSFVFSGASYIPKLFGTKTVFSSIKHLDIFLHCSMCLDKAQIFNLFKLLVEFAHIESLTITYFVLKVLYICNINAAFYIVILNFINCN